MKYPKVKNFYNGQFIESGSTESLKVVSPIDGNLLSQVPMSTAEELNAAVESAKNAFDSWSKLPIKERVQVFFRYRFLLEKNFDELTSLVSEENGKTWDEAKAEVEKSIELTEFACSMPQLIAGEIMEVSRGVECRLDRFPVGVVASIAPFNFPLMVPNWTMPNALVLGNTMIMKPSELVPLSVQRMAELLKEAGLPDGVFNIINGGKEIVEGICAHPGIEAVSFVGSTNVAKLVYQQSTNNLKRCVALGGAKN
ncbi:MAG TPA: aldehyde dehydrogenase family protein, partial [Pyrinomonadaceae bacterium]